MIKPQKQSAGELRGPPAEVQVPALVSQKWRHPGNVLQHLSACPEMFTNQEVRFNGGTQAPGQHHHHGGC